MVPSPCTARLHRSSRGVWRMAPTRLTRSCPRKRSCARSSTCLGVRSGALTRCCANRGGLCLLLEKGPTRVVWTDTEGRPVGSRHSCPYAPPSLERLLQLPAATGHRKLYCLRKGCLARTPVTPTAAISPRRANLAILFPRCLYRRTMAEMIRRLFWGLYSISQPYRATSLNPFPSAQT